MRPINRKPKEIIIMSYITENIPIEADPIEGAHTIGDYENDELQTVTVEYDNGVGTQILYHARPSCKHKIQAQWSGIKCILCNGWYCS